MFMLVDIAIRSSFQAFITSLDTYEALDHVVVDESYLILIASDY